MQQLRGRFLLRVWRLAARRQREERARSRLAACSTAGSLRHSPAAAPRAPGPTSTALLKVPLLLLFLALPLALNAEN